MSVLHVVCNCYCTRSKILCNFSNIIGIGQRNIFVTYWNDDWIDFLVNKAKMHRHSSIYAGCVLPYIAEVPETKFSKIPFFGKVYLNFVISWSNVFCQRRSNVIRIARINQFKTKKQPHWRNELHWNVFLIKSCERCVYVHSWCISAPRERPAISSIAVIGCGWR